MTADARDLRINGEMLDSVDEELEPEIDDDRLARLLADSSEHPQAEMLDREPVVLPPRVHNPEYHCGPIPKEMYVPAVYQIGSSVDASFCHDDVTRGRSLLLAACEGDTMDARLEPAQSSRTTRIARPEGCDRIALILQGGGALGAYQAGVYQALHEAGVEPDWVTGVSIGAINSAIIAGNRPERRLERLRTFWERITERKIWSYTPDGDVFRKVRNAASSWVTIVQGQPGFFSPRQPSPWLSLAGAQSATSYYDNAPLRETLDELVDFSMINDKAVRFAVGAVNVLNGNFIYFDNAHEDIGPEHVMASGALPPALPMVKIGTDLFWDGGIVSNTPLQHLLDQEDDLNSLVFQVDLFSASGMPPRDIQDVMARQKDIMYSSRTRYNTDVYRRIHTWKTRLSRALSKIPEELLSDDERRLKSELADLPEITILQIIYQQKAYEGHAKDYEFSGTSMREHWQSGYEDTKRTLKRRDWLAMPPNGHGIVVHDVHREEDR